MSFTDPRGLVHSGTASGQALESLEQAIIAMLCFKGDPMGLAASVAEECPDVAAAHLLQAHALAFSLHPKLVGKAARVLDLLQPQGLLEREGLHVAAIRAWIERRFEDAADLFKTVITRWPNDLLALMFAHQAGFFAGAADRLAELPEAVLAATPVDMPGRSLVLGMAAFGYEEAGSFALAQALAEQALEARKDDVWAVHALGHVFEMQGLNEQGIRLYRDRQPVWSKDCFFATHNWWHLALYHIDRLDLDGAMAVYAEGIAPDPKSITLNLCDAVAFLWRLHLLGRDVSAPMQVVADLFEPAIDKPVHIFNDVHLAFVLATTGRNGALATLIERQQAETGDGNVSARMQRLVGLPASRAAQAMAEERHNEASSLLERIAPHEHLMTGSRAQRDLLHQTRIEALIRSGRLAEARQLIDADMRAKPNSERLRMQAKRVRAK